MINVSELRIGNSVSISSAAEYDFKSITTIKGVFTNGVYLECRRCQTDNPNNSFEYKEISNKEIYAIPLNENSIGKFNLIVPPKNPELRYYFAGQTGTFFLVKETNSFFLGMEDYGKSRHIMSNILSVHELQNIYFAMYGKELAFDRGPIGNIV